VAQKGPRSLWQRCYFPLWVPTVVVTVGLFVILEVILSFAGVLPANVYEDPFVGFSTTQPLFVPGDSGSQTMVTAENKLRFFNHQAFPSAKGENTFRIFCLGGSTTFGRPYDDNTSFCGWLREMLPAADPSRSWEVINAGGISYASYRVALLMEELLQYEPDLFVIYTGHNEFLEKRTYGRLADGPGLMDSLRGVLGKTRVYTLAKRWHGRSEDTKSKSDGAVLTPEVVTRLEKSVGPEDYTRDALFESDVAEHFRFNLDRMVTLADSAGAAVVFVTPAANLRNCSPFKSEHRPGLADADLVSWESYIGQAEAAAAQEEWTRAEQALDKAIDVDPQYAHAFYLRGRARYAQGKVAEARTDFVEARDLDVCPLRALSVLVEHVRTTAASRHVPCVDFEGQVAEQAEHQIPGNDLFMDHVHPTVDGNRLAAEAILTQLEEMLAINLPSDWETVRMPAIASAVMGRLDTAANALALRNLAQVLSWAGKFEEARDLAIQTIELTPDDPEAHYLLAWNAQSLNDGQLAQEHYRKVVELKPDHAMAALKLAQVLEVTGETRDALALYRKAVAQQPADPKRRVQLAALLVQQGEFRDAAQHYAAALKIKPGEYACHVGLGSIALREGNFREACNHFARALDQAPGDYDAHFGMGEALGRLGDLEQAVRHYNRAIVADPKRPQPHVRLAWFAMHHPDPSRHDADGALSHAEEAVLLSGGANAVALNTLAMAQAFRGDVNQAIETAEQALQRATEDRDGSLTAVIRRQIDQWKGAR
jgi:tetratricopeptide (TPR) repeat protein